MKLKRYKKIQRHMKFFEKHFKFRAPYQILVDGTFAQAALKAKVNIRDQLPKYLDCAVKLLTTPCIINETEIIGPPVYGALQILKQYPYHDCSHVHKQKQGSCSAFKCILAMVGSTKTNRYIVATQDTELRDKLRVIPGVALMYLYGNCPTLEKESEVSFEYAKQKTTEQLQILDYQKEILNNLKKQNNLPLGDGNGTSSKKQKKGTMKKKRLGPNPLSCKKSKPSTKKGGTRGRTSTTPGASSIKDSTETETEDTLKKKNKKKKRNRVRIPKHIRQTDELTTLKIQTPSQSSCKSDS